MPEMPNANHYTYQIAWSVEDDEFIATVLEFPSLSWCEPVFRDALTGLLKLVSHTLIDMQTAGETPPAIGCHLAKGVE